MCKINDTKSFSPHVHTRKQSYLCWRNVYCGEKWFWNHVQFSHTGISCGMAHLVWWPGITGDIERAVHFRDVWSVCTINHPGHSRLCCWSKIEEACNLMLLLGFDRKSCKLVLVCLLDTTYTLTTVWVRSGYLEILRNKVKLVLSYLWCMHNYEDMVMSA